MASKVVYTIGSNVVPVGKKYTQQSKGLYERIRAFFAIEPNRSNGIPVKHYRTPAPGSLDPKEYDDATTTPASDIADNPYWRRDMRRSYPKSSTLTQGDVVGLLAMGSADKPSPKLMAGEEGTKQLVAVQQEGEQGLAVYFEKEKAAAILGEGGMPPMPPAAGKNPDATKYNLLKEQAYSADYPCRVFV
ncbi:hypothetical protein LTS08_007320 [Lithohypha guttulata]|nr:hypothetical protein LTS08_007320 [Lithohypha guttulata]